MINYENAYFYNRSRSRLLLFLLYLYVSDQSSLHIINILVYVIRSIVILIGSTNIFLHIYIYIEVQSWRLGQWNTKQFLKPILRWSVYTITCWSYTIWIEFISNIILLRNDFCEIQFATHKLYDDMYFLLKLCNNLIHMW